MTEVQNTPDATATATPGFAFPARLNELAAEYAPFLTKVADTTVEMYAQSALAQQVTLRVMKAAEPLSPHLAGLAPHLRSLDALAVGSLDKVSDVVKRGVDAVWVAPVGKSLAALEALEEMLEVDGAAAKAEAEAAAGGADGGAATAKTGAVARAVAVAQAASHKTAVVLAAQTTSLQAKMAATLASVAQAAAAGVAYVPFRTQVANAVTVTYGAIVVPATTAIGIDADKWVNTVAALIADAVPDAADAPPASPAAAAAAPAGARHPSVSPIASNTSLNSTLEFSAQGALDPLDVADDTGVAADASVSDSDDDGALDPLDDDESSVFF